MNYPIRYALMPIIERGGFVDDYRDITRAYIVSKCYIISETVRYLENGKRTTTFEVVFPYQYPDLKHQVPKHISETCTNAILVNQVFDNFEDALVVADISNTKLKYRNSHISGSKDWIEKVKEDQMKFDKDLEKYKKIEQMILELTDEMTVSSSNPHVKRLEMKVQVINDYLSSLR